MNQTARDIKPIETVYNGFRFRSRLEARWAVFFDAMRIKYEYEHEGFDLSQGLRYLPDFWLPEFELHAEVKPSPRLSRTELKKLICFASDLDHPLLLIVGSPTNEGMYYLGRTGLDPWGYFEEYESDDDLCDAFWEHITDWTSVEFGFLPSVKGLHLVYRHKPPLWQCNVSEALIRAKQARFEHGRSGN